MKRILPAIVLISVAFTACISKNDLNFKNLQYTNWTPNWALPFVSSSLSLQNMLPTSTLISTDANGLLALNYSGKGYSFRAADYITIPDQHYTSPSISMGISMGALPVGQTLSDSSSSNFTYADPSGSKLEHIGVKSGTFHIYVASTYNQNISIQIVFPNIRNASGPLTLPVSIVYPGTTSNNTADLSGYTIDMTNGSSAQNYVGYKIVYTLTGTGNPITTTSGLTATVDFTDLQYSYIDGLIGHYSIPIPYDSINVGVLNKSIAANIRLQNPKLNIGFTSTFGLTVGATFDSLYGLSTTSGAINDILIPSMMALGQTTIGQAPVSSTWILDSTNSTLRNVLSPIPNYVIYMGHFSINATPATTYGFITDTSSLSFTINATLPACFQIVQLALQDTIMMQMPNDSNLLDSAQFMVQVTNAFPVYAGIQVYFTDSNYIILDSLVNLPAGQPYLIGPAPVDANGVVSGTNVTTSTFVMTNKRYSSMASRIRHGLIRGNLLTSGSSYIQLHATDHLDVKTAFRFALNYAL